MSRHGFQITINGHAEIPMGTSRAQRGVMLREAYLPAKKRLQAFILERDPEATVGGLDNAFPMIIVTMLDEIAFLLRSHPDVRLIDGQDVRFRLEGCHSDSEIQKRAEGQYSFGTVLVDISIIRSP